MSKSSILGHNGVFIELHVLHGTSIYCPLGRTWSSVNTPFPPGIEPQAAAWQSITLPLRHPSSTKKTASLLGMQRLGQELDSSAWLSKRRVVCGTDYEDIHFIDLIGVGYCIPIPDFYLGLHNINIWWWKSTVMDLSIDQYQPIQIHVSRWSDVIYSYVNIFYSCVNAINMINRIVTAL